MSGLLEVTMPIDTTVLSRHVSNANAHLPATLVWPAGTTEGFTNDSEQRVVVSDSGMNDAEENTDTGVFHDNDSTVLVAHADFTDGIIPPIHQILTMIRPSGKTQQQRVKSVLEHSDGVSALLTLARVEA